MKHGHPTQVLRKDWWDFQHKPPWTVHWRHSVLRGDVRKQLRTALAQEQHTQYWANRIAKKEQLRLKEDRLQTGTVLKGTQVAEAEGLRRRAMRQLLTEWFVPGLSAAVLTKFE